jgi:1-acyl-sn-glycerol-3-phosphate acyltransferase
VARFFVRLVCILGFRLFARVKVIGFERLPAQGGYIAASNHVGRLDPALAYYFLNRKDVTLLVAEKYHKYALVRWLVRVLDGVWVDRFGADFKALRQVMRRLEAGGVLVVAPEGTRSRTGALIQARPGSSYLAARAGVPVVPVGITGTEDQVVLGRLRRLRRLDITVRVGQPFLLPPLDAKNREQALQGHTDEIMCQIAALLPPDYRGVYANHPRLIALLNDQESETGHASL